MRLKLFAKDFWVIDVNLDEKCSGLKFEKIAKILSPTVLQFCPQCYPFTVRAKIFTHILDSMKIENHHGFFNSGSQIQIRRDYILEDAFDQIFVKKINLQAKFRIQFIDSNLEVEDGIDGGGLLKEFITKLTERIFDPQYAFFLETEQRALYPNVLAQKTHNNVVQLFEFFGMIVGKALFEGTLLKCNFARFFLNKMVDKSN